MGYKQTCLELKRTNRYKLPPPAESFKPSPNQNSYLPAMASLLQHTTSPMPPDKARLILARDQNCTLSSAELLRKPKQFSDLPAELRHQIWHAAIVPRLVWFPKDTSGNLEGHLRVWHHRVTTQPGKKDLLPPGSNKTALALLGACKESRGEIGPCYREMFGYTNTANDLRFQFLHWNREKKGVVFNPDVDILMMCMGTAEDLVSYGTADLQELRYLAINDEDMVCESNGGTHIKCRFPVLVDIFLKCPNLERLYLCLEDPEEWFRTSEERYKEGLDSNLQAYVGEHIDYWEEFEENVLLRKEAEECERLKKLARRWREIASVKFLGEIKAELGAASTEMT